MEHRDKDGQSDTEEGLQRIKLRTMAMQSLIEKELHSQPLMVHYLHTKKPLQRLLSCARTTLCFSLSPLPPVQRNQRKARERDLLKNHTATMLLRSSALKRRLNKAVKKLIPWAGVLANTQIQTREPGATENAA